MKRKYNSNLCNYLKIDPNKKYHLKHIINLFDGFRMTNGGYFIHDRLIRILKRNNNIVNWNYIDETKFIKLITSLQIEEHNYITKFKSEDIGILVEEIYI